MPPQLIPPIGLPTAFSAAEDDAWSALLSAQLDDARKTAENWRNGLAAIVGVIVAFSAIKGPDDVSGLEYPLGYAVGALLLAALLSGGLGAGASLTAAYGTPSVMNRNTFHEQGGIDGYRLALAMTSASKLHCAQVATIITLALLAAAIGLTWYGPRAESVMLEVESKSLPTFCGTLLSSSTGHIDIKPLTSGRIRLNLADVTKLTAVDKCS